MTEKVYQGMWNLFKIDNKNIKKEHGKDMFIVHQKNTWKKVWDTLQFVNKEMQSETQLRRLTFNRFDILY